MKISVKGAGNVGATCADAIARVIEERLSKHKNLPGVKIAPEAIKDKTDEESASVKIANIVGVCPDCGSALKHEEGCVICAACGYSRC